MNTEQFDGHTPGPWDYEIPETGDNIIIDSEGLFVAQVACRADCKNAELIAVAPDLKDALIKEREENKRLRQAFLIATGHIGYGNHLGHTELRHALNSAGIDADSLSWAEEEWSEEE